MKTGPYSIGSDTWPGLSKVIEEAGEVLQVAGKLIGAGGRTEHFDGSDLRRRLEDELADLRAAISFLGYHNNLDWTHINDRTREKRAQLDRWHAENGGS